MDNWSSVQCSSIACTHPYSSGMCRLYALALWFWCFFFLHKSLFCFQLCVEADTIDVDKLCLWIRACIPNTSNFVRLTFVCILCAQLSLATGHKSIWQKEQKHTQAMISCEPCTCSSLLRTFSYAVFVWCVPIAHKHKVGWVYKFICFLSWPFFVVVAICQSNI